MISLLRNNSDAKLNSTDLFSKVESQKALAFHKTIPNYLPTSLISLNRLSEKLGVSKVWIKDESHRFDLKAFKVPGASYAAAKYFFEQNEMRSIMAGLCCGTPDKIAFDILNAYSDFCITHNDKITKNGVRILDNHESGAVTTGLIHYLQSGKTICKLQKNCN